ncbi:hypothetical protein ACFLU5_12245 [Bacteroidota bacterium]
MNSSNRKQLIGISIYSLIILLAGMAFKLNLPDWIYSQFIWLVLFFLVITFASLLVINKAIETDPDNIARNYFGAMFIRLFISVIVAIVIIYYDRENSTVFAGNFVILYLMYLGFEIYTLITNLQIHSDEGEYPHEKEEER